MLWQASPYTNILYVGRSIVSRDNGQYEAALADLDKVLARDATLDVAYYERGVTYREAGALDESLADLNRAVAIPDTYQCR